MAGEVTSDASSWVFTFAAGAEPIQLDDKEVVFSTMFGPMQLKAKFTLKDMVYQSKLEL